MNVSYINLARRPDRDKRFLSLNKDIAEFERIEGVDGEKLDIEVLIHGGILQERLHRYSPGGIGCALSHRRLWERCIANDEVMTIAEDDAVFNRHFVAKAAMVMKQLPLNWDIILWGWNFDSILHAEILGGINRSIMEFETASLKDEVHSFQRSLFDVVALRLQNAFGTVCYSVSPQGAKRLNDLCFPLKNETVAIPSLGRELPNLNIDTVMNKYYRELKAFVCFPPLVWTENDKKTSDVADVMERDTNESRARPQQFREKRRFQIADSSAHRQELLQRAALSDVSQLPAGISDRDSTNAIVVPRLTTPLITFVVACKGRLSFLKQTLPTLVRLPCARWVMVDFDCPEKSGDWVEQTYPQVHVVRVANRPRHSQSEAHNLGAAHVVTPWVCFTDADIMFDPTFCDKVLQLLKPGSFWRALPKAEGTAGTTICAKADFDKVGGYDEIIKGWGYEDTDFMNMLKHLHVQEKSFPATLISHIYHENTLRGKHQDNKDIRQTWRVNKLYSFLKFTLQDNSKTPLDIRVREKLHTWAMQTTAQLAEGKPVPDLKVSLNRWDLDDTCDFLVNTTMVYSIEKKT